jgi:two-component system LytT family response regulator
MRNIRTIVVDDEKPARERLKELLDREPDILLAGAARDGDEAVRMVREQSPDLLFLDIQMPGRDGFGVLEAIDPDTMPVTIFVTAYDRYALQAFEAQALDYLLKPFSDERFETALERARRLVRSSRDDAVARQLSLLLNDRTGAAHLQRIVIKSNGRVTFLDVAEIEWIEAAGVYVYLHTAAKSYLYRATIGQIQERLDPNRFVRVHRSAAVNTGVIRELQLRGHGEYEVVLKNGKEIPLSRKYRPGLEAWLKQPL